MSWRVGRDVSGIGTHETNFEWDASALSGAYLDLGPLVESAKVYLNGTKAENLHLKGREARAAT